jgi:hypothetical protein
MKRILFILAQVCLLLVSANVVRAQNHVQTITVTNSPTTITADGNYNQVLVRENAATPSAAFSITLSGTSTALNYPAGTQFLFTGNFVNGQAIGTIQATTAGPFTFMAVEANGPPSMSVKNTILTGGSSGNATSIQGLAVSSSAPTGGVNCFETNSGDTQALWTPCGSGGTVTTFSAGNLSPLFASSVANATSTPALTFTLSNAGANSVFGNCTGSSAAPSYCSITGAMLPNPSATTLGGVESLIVVAHNFLTGISTSGVPSQAQPAFTDISGSVTAAQLPNPGASSLGGIESLAATSHQWINAISTSGVPSSTQPAFTDISGTLGIGAGGTNATSAANALINLFPTASEVGDIVYCSAYSSGCTAWSILAGNTSGTKVLQETSSGAPSWVANGGGLSGATTNAPLYATSATAFSSTSSAGAAGQPFKSGGSGAAPAYASDNACYASSTSDQITSAGAFATTCSVPSTNLAAGTVIEIYFHGVWTTSATSSPKLNFEINAGGTTGECPAATTAVALTASQTNGVFDGVCRILITTTGSSGTAIAGGNIQTENGAGGGGLTQGFNNASTVTYNTTTAETVSVQETTAMVSGQTMNLQSLVVRVIP